MRHSFLGHLCLRHLCLASLLAVAAAPSARAASILIDFGNASTFRGVTSPGNWNSVAFGFAANLIDTSGSATTVDWAPDGFGGTDSFNSLIGPTTNPPTSGEIAQAQAKLNVGTLGNLALGEAAIDFFKSNNGTTNVGRFQLQQMIPGQLYNLTFYGSKQFVTAGNEQTRYSVFDDSGYSNLLATGTLVVGTTNDTGNPGSTVTLSNLVGPSNANNIFYVQWEGVNNTAEGFINSMEIQPVPEPSTSVLLGLACVALAGLSRRRSPK